MAAATKQAVWAWHTLARPRNAVNFLTTLLYVSASTRQHNTSGRHARHSGNATAVVFHLLLLQGNTVDAKHARQASPSRPGTIVVNATRKGAHQFTQCPGMIQHRMLHLMQNAPHTPTRPANRLSHAPKLGNLSACTGQPGTGGAVCASHHSISSNAWRVCTHTVNALRNESMHSNKHHLTLHVCTCLAAGTLLKLAAADKQNHSKDASLAPSMNILP